jgi:ATP-dependent RNA helicase DDX46/PRP5
MLRGDHEQLVDDDEEEQEEQEVDPEAAAELKKKRDDARAMADAKAKVMAALTKDIDTSTDSHARGDRLKAWVAARAAKHTAEAVAKDRRGSIAESSDFASESEAEGSSRRLNRDGGGLDTLEDDDDVPSAAAAATATSAATPAIASAASSITAPAPASAVEEEEDPLDAFMKGVQMEVQKVQAADAVVFGAATAAARLQPTLAPMVEQQESDDDKSSDDGKIDIYKLIERKTQCKNLNAIDHAAQDYPPFRRKFYIEVAEISKLTQEEVDKIREDNDAIQVNKSAPKPILEWWQAGLSERIESVIRKLQWAQPSPIQKQLLPVAMSGRDCVGVAKTGSGKTAAYLLPLFRHCMDQERVVPGEVSSSPHICAVLNY